MSVYIALIFGMFVHYIPLSCTSSPCNLLFLNLGIQLFSQVPAVSVLIHNEGTIGEGGTVCGVGVHEWWTGGHPPFKNFSSLSDPRPHPHSQAFVGFSCFMAYENMGVYLKFYVPNTFLCLHAFGNVGRC